VDLVGSFYTYLPEMFGHCLRVVNTMGTGKITN